MAPDTDIPRLRRSKWMPAASTSVALLLLGLAATPARAYDVSAEVKLYNEAHHQVGKAKLTDNGDGTVAVHANVHGLTPGFPGFHGFHVHAIGTCTIEPNMPAFASAGGHFDSGGHAHGDHAGDFPALLVRADGTANVKFNTDRFTLEALFDSDGSAVIIHAGRDNYANIPPRYAVNGVPGPDTATLATGDSGARVACGVVERIVKRDRGHDDKDDRDDKGHKNDR